jgi:hypothetical protein
MPDSVHPKRLTRLPRARLLAAVVAAAVGLAACGGASAPHVASLGNSSGTGSGNASGSSATTPATGTATGSGSSASKAPKGDATALLDEWATCMYSHGDPNQVDPTVDAYGVINITIPADAQDLSGAVHGGTDPCNQYVAAAQRGLRAANPVSPRRTRPSS